MTAILERRNWSKVIVRDGIKEGLDASAFVLIAHIDINIAIRVGIFGFVLISYGKRNSWY